MNVNQILIDAFSRTEGDLERALAGLTVDQIHFQPNPDANSIAWTAWHLARVGDNQISALAGTPQCWVSDNWAARFGMPADPKNTGFKHTPAEVAAFRSPSVQILLDYYRAMAVRTTRYLETVTEADLDRVLDEPYDPKPTVGVRINSVINDLALHSGEIAYIRGLITGRGWQSF